MELIIVAAGVLVIVYLIYRNTGAKALEVLDVNRNGKVDLEDVKLAADVNEDGKVDILDAKAAVKKTKAAAKRVAAKATTRGRKPKKA